MMRSRTTTPKAVTAGRRGLLERAVGYKYMYMCKINVNISKAVKAHRCVDSIYGEQNVSLNETLIARCFNSKNLSK